MKYTEEEKTRAKKADLIFIPMGLKERCSNCKFIKNGYCKHPKIDLKIEDPVNECCGYWDNDRIDRKRTQE